MNKWAKKHVVPPDDQAARCQGKGADPRGGMQMPGTSFLPLIVCVRYHMQAPSTSMCLEYSSRYRCAWLFVRVF